MRVYIPVTVDELGTVASGSWEPAQGFAVTERLLEISEALDPDEVAEEALYAAGMESALELDSRLRAVAVVDYPRPDVTPMPELHPAAVRVSGTVATDAIACVFVDEPAAEQDVSAAHQGHPGAEETLGSRDLLWYDVSEIPSIPLS